MCVCVCVCGGGGDIPVNWISKFKIEVPGKIEKFVYILQ